MACSSARRMRMRASRRSTSKPRASRARRRRGADPQGTRRRRRRLDLGASAAGRAQRRKLIMPFRPALARERVMHVGQPVALVVAESVAQAKDAAEQVAVDYEELAAVADARAALARGAPQLLPEAPGNVALDWPGPVPDDGSNARAMEKIFAAAAHVARVSVVNQRLVVNTMEPRGATARYDAATDFYTLRSCSQGADPQREQLVAMTGLPREKVRIITEDVGGAFGLKTAAYPEYPALLVAAKLTGRPVAWMATRSESFLSDQQARDTVTQAELAIDPKGKFLALRVKHLAAMGGVHRHARREHPDEQFLALLSRHVCDPAHPGGRAMRVHQHGADRPLSRRRAAGGELRAGAPGRRGRARHRHRSGAAAAAQPDPAEGDPLQDRGRHHLRLRRLRADPREGAGARALQRASRSAAASRSGARSCAASASRASSSMRARCRPKARRCCFPAATSSCSASACRTPDRATRRSIRA